MIRRFAAASLAALLCIAPAASHAADGPLTICLDENLPPLSVHHGGKPESGFDVALAHAIADRLGRPLKIQWFESKLDEDSSPALEANALLSDGRCILIGGYAFTPDALTAPGMKTAKLPDFQGATRDDRRRRVVLGVLAPSKPYVYVPLTIVLGAKARERKIEGVGDLRGLRIAIESGTVADAILMTFDDGRLIDDITHLVPGRSDLLGAIDRGEFDATLLDLRRFDAYRATHPNSSITASGFYHPVGTNRGYVTLAGEAALLDEVNKVLAELQAAGTLAQLGQAAGLTYLAPHEAAAGDDVWKKVLNK
jgi:ABC-type amino acid transport substrate-binding protein